MMHFQSQAANPAPGNTNQGELVSLISSFHSPVWINPSASSLGIVLDVKGLEVSAVDPLQVNPHLMSDIEDWESMVGSIATDVCCLRPSNNTVHADSPDPNEELCILDALVEKCSQPEDSRLNIDPSGGLPQVARSNMDMVFPSFEIDRRRRDASDTHEECIENDPKLCPALKAAAKRSGRSMQLRPPKRSSGRRQQLVAASEISQREIHIQSERQRRRGMNHLFDTMRSMLPNPIQKTDKSTIVSEMINYIQSLQQQLQDLNKKRERILSSPREILRMKSEQSPAESIQSECTAANSPVSSTTSPNEECARQASHLTLHSHENHVFITMSCGKTTNLLGAILFVLEYHNLQVINANVSTTDSMAFHCFHVKALKSPDLVAREALKCALQKFLSPGGQISLEQGRLDMKVMDPITGILKFPGLGDAP